MEEQQQQRVLVVEDEVLIRMAISSYLRDCGYQVVEAANADEAVVILSSDKAKLDVVFTDVEMPGTMNGFGLASWLRENRPNIPVILAGNLEKTADAAAELCEFGPMLSKPYEPQTLLDQIKRLLAGIAPG